MVLFHQRMRKTYAESAAPEGGGPIRPMLGEGGAGQRLDEWSTGRIGPGHDSDGFSDYASTDHSGHERARTHAECELRKRRTSCAATLGDGHDFPHRNDLRMLDERTPNVRLRNP